jgi:hypothetical protein
MSPYIVTTRQPAKVDHDEERAEREHVSRRAVATLEEARDFIYSLCAETDVDDERIADDIDRLPESGGSVGPLPDGAVIEVEQTTWRDLGWVGATMPDSGIARSLTDAYNARQGE